MEERVEAWRLRFEQQGVPMFQAAHEALLEFGGLKVTREGVPEWVREPARPFDLDPELVAAREGDIGLACLCLEYKLYPIGDSDEVNDSSLFIDEQGWIHLWHSGFFFIAPSLREALRGFIRGR